MKALGLFSEIADIKPNVKKMNTEQEILESPKKEQPVKPSKESGKRPSSALFLEFSSKWQALASVEDRLRLTLDFMRSSLAQSGSPSFKDFWEARRFSLPLFKENINPLLRSQFWGEFAELSLEARRLKEILDEQSSFAAEQIHLAITSMEEELEKYETLVPQIELPSFPENNQILQERKDFYFPLQRELGLLNHLASRVNSLRKETVKVEMRIRQKNQFFERLSSIGDKVFPKRKELIKTLSEEFITDVNAFIQKNFADFPENKLPAFLLREEIKSLQEVAKILTLNTFAFTQTRLQLSECWDKLKLFEKERKKEVIQKKMASRQNYDLVMEKIAEHAAFCLTEEACSEIEEKKLEEIYTFMREIELGREEVKSLRSELQKARKPILDKEEAKRLEKEQEKLQAQKIYKDRISTLKANLEALFSSNQHLTVEKMEEQVAEYKKEMEELTLQRAEKFPFERLFKQIKDILSEKKEVALLNLSQDEKNALDQLYAVLQQKKARRQEMKLQLENYRKSLGNSGLDFEKAMLLREMIDEEKEALEKINLSISEIEEKIREFEGS